jgi:hypothetical protein
MLTNDGQKISSVAIKLPEPKYSSSTSVEEALLQKAIGGLTLLGSDQIKLLESMRICPNKIHFLGLAHHFRDQNQPRKGLLSPVIHKIPAPLLYLDPLL